MNEEVKSQWVAELRSGKYTQGQYALRVTDGDQVTHCCLGVLCELAVKAGVVKRVTEEAIHEGATPTNALFDDNAAFLPYSVMKWAGLDTSSGFFAAPDEQRTRSLTGLNDEGITFSGIADIIEKQF